MKKIRVYITSGFSNRAHVKICMTLLSGVSKGIEISHDWTSETWAGVTGSVLEVRRRQTALAGYEGVKTCDYFILLRHKQGCACYTELGMAIALGKKVIVCDSPEPSEPGPYNVFYALPEAKCVEGFFQALQHIVLEEGL